MIGQMNKITSLNHHTHVARPFSLQIEPGYIEKRLCHTMPVLCENPMLASVIDMVISSSFLAVQPQLLLEMKELVPMWFVEGQPLDYYRSAYYHFVASVGGKYFYISPLCLFSLCMVSHEDIKLLEIKIPDLVTISAASAVMATRCHPTVVLQSVIRIVV